ncbi:MAG TPA: LemA family protein [Acidimicrobiales bacterium]|nr:LemA family protein [Acidimicrobiales bacterium]
MRDFGRMGGSRPRWLVPLVVVGAVVLLLVLPLIGTYNGLVNREADVDQAFADVDTQLQRRNDLIPNLVAAVRGILGQEQAVFGELARARQAYAGAATPEEKVDAANAIDAGIGRLLVIVEAYPELRSSENVRDLQVQLEGTENRIVQARRDYNGQVTSYNKQVKRFPRSLVAGLFGFDEKPLFRATPESRTVPSVDLGTDRTATTLR